MNEKKTIEAFVGTRDPAHSQTAEGSANGMFRDKRPSRARKRSPSVLDPFAAQVMS